MNAQPSEYVAHLNNQKVRLWYHQKALVLPTTYIDSGKDFNPQINFKT
jgi:hypothetical protein